MPVKTVASTVVDVYFFYSKNCPHCLRQKPLMEDINIYNPDVKVHLIEVSEDSQTWQDFRERYNIRSGAVSRTFIGEMSFVGCSESDGSLEYVSAYGGYIGYQNQILDAIATAVGYNLQLDTATTPWWFPWLVLRLPSLYPISFPLLEKSSAIRPGSTLLVGRFRGHLPVQPVSVSKPHTRHHYQELCSTVTLATLRIL